MPPQPSAAVSHAAAAAAAGGSGDAMLAGDAGSDEVWCLCREPSYGDMVRCDNKECDIGWFHLDCVGLERAPTGEWLCPNCRPRPKKRASRMGDRGRGM